MVGNHPTVSIKGRDCWLEQETESSHPKLQAVNKRGQTSNGLRILMSKFSPSVGLSPVRLTKPLKQRYKIGAEYLNTKQWGIFFTQTTTASLSQLASLLTLSLLLSQHIPIDMAMVFRTSHSSSFERTLVRYLINAAQLCRIRLSTLVF